MAIAIIAIRATKAHFVSIYPTSPLQAGATPWKLIEEGQVLGLTTTQK